MSPNHTNTGSSLGAQRGRHGGVCVPDRQTHRWHIDRRWCNRVSKTDRDGEM